MLTQAALLPLERLVHVVPATTDDRSLQFLFEKDSAASAILLGDSRKILKLIPSNTFQMCITSPPYWSLRNYNIEGQIGLEGSIHDYIKSLAAVCEEVRR